MAGTVNIARGIFAHLAFRSQPLTEREAFIWLVMEASWKPRMKRVGNEIFSLRRGQLAASVRFMAEAWGWQKSSVDRYLKRLKKWDMINTENGTGCNLITICNYNKYQGGEENVGTAKAQEPGQWRDSSGTNYKKVAIPEASLKEDDDVDSALAVENSSSIKADEPTFRERILDVVGVDRSGMTGRGGTRIGTQADMIVAGKWVSDLKLTEAEVLAEIASVVRSKTDGPPSSFKYFTGSMQRLAGTKQDAVTPLTPQSTGASNGSSNKNRNNEDLRWIIRAAARGST